jgi:hypothetical protein
MASIALTVAGCIDYLAYGTIFTLAMFLPKINLMFFFRQKSRRCLPGGGGWVMVERREGGLLIKKKLERVHHKVRTYSLL